jgi:cytoskeleton protein RodZ
MRQKIDIADVEAATKIRAKYLRALENEEFGLLPGPTFAKTFLRSYAEYLGLDGQLLVEEYRVQHEPRGEEFAPIRPNRGRPAPRDRRDRRPRRGPPGPGVAIGAVVVVLLVLLFALGSIGGGGSDNKGGSGQQSSDTTPAQTAKETAAQRKKRLKAEKKKAAADRRAALLKKPISLKIAPAVPIYACIVDSSGGTVFVGTVSAAQTFKAKKRMQINLGRSTSVTVTVDGKKLSIPPGSVPVGYDLRKGKKPKPLTTRPTCA